MKHYGFIPFLFILHLDLFAYICSTFHWVETVIEAGNIKKLKVMIDELIKEA